MKERENSTYRGAMNCEATLVVVVEGVLMNKVALANLVSHEVEMEGVAGEDSLLSHLSELNTYANN